MPVEGRPLRDLAVAFGYSAMALTKVAGELEAKALASVSRDGKTRRLRFGEERRALWDRAQPILASPVRVRQWVRGRGGRMPGLVAGLTALERLTEIAGDRLPTLALARRDLKGFIDRGDLVVCRFPDEAEAAVEGWSYDPARLAAGESVDALSLYLSLRETADERVRKELRRLLEGVAW
jgi:DNA-binding MarR family transcriptional regulator